MLAFSLGTFHITSLLVYVIHCCQSLQNDFVGGFMVVFLVESLFCWTVASLLLQKALKVTVILRSLLFPCALSPLLAQAGKGAVR